MTAIDIVLVISSFLGFVFLLYGVLMLMKRKEYENPRIKDGYNALIFSVFILALYALLKTIKYGSIAFNVNLFNGNFFYLDVLAQAGLLPLFCISLITGMLLFKRV